MGDSLRAVSFFAPEGTQKAENMNRSPKIVLFL